jgi:hypothetical protein
MYTDALEFLEEEREAWAAYEALDRLSDEALERPTDPTGPGHGWSGRALMVHLVYWQEVALRVARELAVGQASPTLEAMDAAWEAQGDALNEAQLEEARALPLEEVRRRFRSVPGELRGYLTVVPETRWVKHPTHMAWLAGQTLDHYADHEADLRAILAAAG